MIGWLVLAGIGLLAWKGKELLNFQEKVQVRLLGFRIHSLDLNGLTVIVRAALDNPTGATVRILQPYIEVYDGDSLLANTVPGDKVITVAPRARTELGELRLQIPAFKLLSSLLQAPQLVQQYRETGKLGKTLRVRVQTSANGIPATTEQSFTI